MRRFLCWLNGHVWQYQRSDNLSVDYYYVCERCRRRYAMTWV